MYFLVIVKDKVIGTVDAFAYAGDWDTVKKRIIEEYTSMSWPRRAPEPRLFEPFEGWDADDSEFGPYQIWVFPLTDVVAKDLALLILEQYQERGLTLAVPDTSASAS